MKLYEKYLTEAKSITPTVIENGIYFVKMLEKKNLGYGKSMSLSQNQE